ncbi:sulfofructosephosphate aldolase [Naasia aerilata]|uniref:Sulfofructosephosphate aldolase n=2 Tax=Naasia aerilata TaxID=1162966 RepID=A0ABM8GBT2_9MICO|nr:sulfofructosephosphate aldolase [Naasia aerilata]
MTRTMLTLDAIARPGGGFAMVAMDQRESLRAMFDAAGVGRPADDVLVQFKMDVARELGPLASGFLIDRHYGFERVRDEGILPESDGLILAADALQQEDGGPVEETELDETVVGGATELEGVSALKLLIIWRRDERREHRVELADRFVRRSAELGLLSVLEPVVRATPAELDAGTWNMDDAIVEAARELSPLGPSLYKAQVPMAGKGDFEDQRRASERLGTAIGAPWVVLSQGVDREHFLPAVEAACQAGASGFLAGRALWSDVVGAPDVPARLRELSRPRLEALIDVVDRTARPWSDAR